MDSPFRLRLPARPESVRAFRHALSEHVVALGGRDGHVSAVALGVTEAVTNAVRHGYPEGMPGQIEVEAARSGDWLDVAVHDDGCGPKETSHDPGLGLGVPLMKDMAEEFRLEDNGNGTTARMRFDLR